ncbi:MAG TPA: tRNA lysidine(34) synthetase TilS [Verrucomicrobiae bacterium]
MTDLLNQVSKNLTARKLLARGESVLVAVSGGVDSMVLLHVLHQLALENSWKLAVAHLNHQLRGRSSDADERLVIKTAKRLGIQIVTERANIRSHAKSRKLSIEMAAREVRHDFLARTAKRLKFAAIALAHHADDQLELFFLRLLRGSGKDGLSGMKWKSRSPNDPKLSLIRPLLNVSKAELLAFAVQNKIAFREDATNASIDFQRNRIRNELLPLLRQNYQPSLNRVIHRIIEITEAESDFLQRTAEDWLANKSSVPFCDLHPALQRRCVQIQLQRLAIASDFDLIEALRTEPGRIISAGKDLWVVCSVEGQIQSPCKTVPQVESGRTQIRLNFQGSNSFAELQFDWRITKSKSPIRPSTRTATEMFDADQVGNEIVLRHWQPGDRFQPIGMTQPVKLQDLFTNQKIPRAERHQLTVATTKTGELFWVERLRISERFKVTGRTIRRLLWHWKPR